MNETVQNIDNEKDLTSCPTCDYKDGFHIGFRTIKDSTMNEIIVICPNCHNRLNIGWGIKLNR